MFYEEVDVSYTLVSPSLSFLKGVAKLKNLQAEVSYVLVCAAEAWWYPKMWEKLSLNEFWLKIQERFNQDHQDFDRAAGEVFKLVWIKRSKLSVEGVQEKIEVKSKY